MITAVPSHSKVHDIIGIRSAVKAVGRFAKVLSNCLTRSVWLGLLGAASMAADGPGLDRSPYTPGQVGTILSFVDTGAAISGVSMHRGYLIVPMGADHGGGQGAGALTVFNVSNLANPVEVFDSRDMPEIYQTPGVTDYMGDFAEMHHICIAGDLMLVSERHTANAGFSLLDLSPLYDGSAAPRPRIISRFIYPGGAPPSSYDGFSFAPAWQGSRYVYAPTGSGGLYVVDTSNPANPTLLKHMPRSSLSNMTLRSATVIGNLLVLTAAAVETSFNGLILDISDPADPKQLSSFSGPLGYQGFVYGGSFYGAGKPLVRHDFTDPRNVVATTLASGAALNLLDRQEYGFGKDEHIHIGHYPGATKWLLSGNSATFVNRVNSGINPPDDHAFITPLGNALAIATDHNNPRKLIFGVHAANSDTRPPEANFQSPAKNATNVHPKSRVGVCFTDFIDAGSVTTDTFRVRVLGQQRSVEGTLSVKEGIVNFVPAADLEADTTYEVFLAAGGLRDYAGNPIPQDTVLNRFSTGSAVTEYSTKVVAANPALVGSSVGVRLEVTSHNGQPVEHSWDFGDGTEPTAYGTAVEVSHTYATPGNHVVTVRTREIGRTDFTAASGVQVIHLPVPSQSPINSSTIVYDPLNAKVWAVNPDNGSVSAIRTSDNTRVHETAVGADPKSLALGPDNRLWVANKESDSLSVLDRATGVTVATHALLAGCAPHGVLVHPSLDRAYVSMEALGEVAEIDTRSGAILRRVTVGPWPRALALDPLEGTLWVSHFISPEDAGKVTALALESFAPTSVVDLAPVRDPDTASGGMGLPNYLGSLAISPDYSHLYVPAKKDNIFRGIRRNGEQLTFEHAVRSMASGISLPARIESVDRRLDFDNSDFVTSLVYSPKGNQVFFVSSGSSFIWVIDAYNRRNPYSIGTGGLAPDGLAISPDGTRLYVNNFMSRTITVLATSTICNGVCGTSPMLAMVPTVTTEALAADVLLGKQIFYNSEDPRLSSDSYMSCASCHLDGGHDGRVWDFSGMGEGFRNTIDLNGRGIGHGPLHWTANFDEVHDFEGQIRELGGGSGLMGDADFNKGTVSQPLGQSKAGFSAELDALAAYVSSLSKAGRSPFRAADGGLTTDAVRGREIFMEENCASCHSGSAFTDSAGLARHDVGTLAEHSGERMGGQLDGLDTPGLRGLWKTAPYLHDGSAPTLTSVFGERDLSGHHGGLFHRSPAEIDQLVSYLLQIDDLEIEAPVSKGGEPPVMSVPERQVSTVGRSSSLEIVGSDPDGGKVTFHASGLPAGMSLDETTGIISGVPSTAAIHTVRVSVRDGEGKSEASTFEWEVISSGWVPPLSPTERGDFRYVKFVSTSTHNNYAWTVISEFNVLDDNLQALNRDNWQITADSEETARENGRVIRAFDGLPTTFWHTRWSGASPPAHPHEMIIDMGSSRRVGGFSIAPRQDAATGRVRGWIFYGSQDGVNWAQISSGNLNATYDTQMVSTPMPVQNPSYRYVKFDAVKPHGEFLWSVISEFNVLDANGLPLSRTGWIASADSEETVGENGRASRALDGYTSTFWHTRWSGEGLPGYPHSLVLDMLTPRRVGGFTIAPRQDSSAGRVKDWRFHGSSDGVNWTLLGTGTLASTFATQTRFTGGGRGHIPQESWNDATGGSLADLAAQDHSNQLTTLELRSSFEASEAVGATNVTRMRGYLLPPATGTYHFWIASDDDSVLRLSPNHEESRVVPVASVPDATGKREWTRYESQRSGPVNLVAGHVYYIDALRRGGGHLAVAWSGPGMTSPTVIDGRHLMPEGWFEVPRFLQSADSAPDFTIEEGVSPGSLVGIVHATDPASNDPLVYEISGGNPEGKFAIDGGTGKITVTGEIDYEKQPLYWLAVTVRNPVGGAIAIQVRVMVLNRVETNEEAVRISLTDAGGAFEGHGNPALIGFASDPDADGIANALEVFFGSDPASSDTIRPIRFSPTESGGEIRMAYEFDVKLPTAGKLDFRCLGTSDLLHWSPINTEPEILGEEDGIRTYRIVDDQSVDAAGKRMMKIVVESGK